MKRFILSILSLSWTILAFAQQVDQGRDLSKYADDKFRDDDKYKVETPYETVTVS